LLDIYKIVNSPIPSNCFLIIDKATRCCIVVDPGSFNDNDNLITYIIKNNLSVSYVILTHEHFDHIAGVDKLYSKFQFELICNRETAIGIANSKKNLSAFNDQMLPVEINITPSIVKDTEHMVFAGNTLTFYDTPGHSPGSMCFSIDQYFFSGDTFLFEHKTRLNLPGSNKKQYIETQIRLRQIIKTGMHIFPGHGICFDFDYKKLNII
jgi:glyoxylase-like metal-dependent hydrolase (beta-lactamase superfamily II)